MIDYKVKDSLHIITMTDGSGISPKWQQIMLEVLGRVELGLGQGSALLLTGVDKSFCSGLNLQEFLKLSEDERPVFGTRMSEIFRRLLLLPCPTVAALNGHAFAAGAVLALCCDYRVMREDRGWFCISEVDMGVPIPAPLMGIVRAKLPAATLRDAVLTGHRYTADEAISAGIVDNKASLDDLLSTSEALAKQLATKEPGIYETLKKTLFADVGGALSAPA